MEWRTVGRGLNLNDMLAWEFISPNFFFFCSSYYSYVLRCGVKTQKKVEGEKKKKTDNEEEENVQQGGKNIKNLLFKFSASIEENGYKRRTIWE